MLQDAQRAYIGLLFLGLVLTAVIYRASITH
jgi:hypothetical protein